MIARLTSRPFWLLAIVTAAALGTLLGSRGLDEPDEGRYAEIGREMAVTGRWMVPHLNGFEHFQKPPMLYWMTATAIRVGGANEWAARFPSALAGLGVVLLTAWIGTTLLGARAGFLAGLILLSSGGFFALARLLTPDMLLTFWVVAAIACFLQYALRRQGRIWAVLFFVSLGCGFLTKGPLALVIPLCGVLAWRFRSRDEQEPALPWSWGIPLALSLGLSWFVALSLWRHELFQYFWRYELVERFASSAHGRTKPWWFFAPVILIAALPWTFWIPLLAVQTWRRLRRPEIPPGAWLLLGWTVPPFLILSLSGSKLSTYILPLLPALSLGLAWCLTREKRRALWVPPLAGGCLLLFLTGAGLLPYFNDRLGQQASLREAVRPLARDGAFAKDRFCAVDVRAHGFEFYLQQLVTATREQSDLVLQPTPEQEQRLLTTEKFTEQAVAPQTGGPRVTVLLRRQRVRNFPPERWSEIGHAGDFVLLRSRPEKLAAAVVPP